MFCHGFEKRIFRQSNFNYSSYLSAIHCHLPEKKVTCQILSNRPFRLEVSDKKQGLNI